jgi:hypothetical protein
MDDGGPGFVDRRRNRFFYLRFKHPKPRVEDEREKHGASDPDHTGNDVKNSQYWKFGEHEASSLLDWRPSHRPTAFYRSDNPGRPDSA